MKLSFTLLTSAVLFTLASAQFDVPSCAKSCLNDALSKKVGNCHSVDVTCICRNDNFVKSLGTCIQSSCPETEFQETIRSASKYCQENGVNITEELPKNSTVNENGTSTTNTTAGPSATGNAANNLMAGSAGIVGAAVAALLFF
ncbi:hypothetical protein DFH27DRAFT_30291 [Peziza echinospora]|nr:hypothetical protein DFH27DRAFT_30291 [Peziza echinospora]